MEHRAFASAFGVLAAALVVVGPQSSTADPSGTQEEDDGWTKTAEAGVSVVSKMLRAAPPTASEQVVQHIYRRTNGEAEQAGRDQETGVPVRVLRWES